MTEIKRIDCGTRMSEAVIFNGVAWLAGQVGNGATVAEQTEDALAEVDALLTRIGSDRSRILSAQIWLADIAEFEEMNAVRDAWVVPGHAPARATGEARLASAQYRVEIIVNAAV
ncbi:RidA family protein [Falsirhodobacter sp. 20TX0035]|uniref:RidA family protein n=1 Tax=Falsirhodobacter sp. 20TX0035 TaxID=3022019 RepID=UPI00232BDDE4|nr:RidA family protein [Falsirhodobacter sp. 20TX0035]MDB6453556.1 RidA family protein [Falsirhodobacter sp. 20TX0035]